jgi:hypothetical protein
MSLVVIGNTVWADRDPTQYDDLESFGYAKGTQWRNASSGVMFLCLNETPNNASWAEFATVIKNTSTDAAPTVDDDVTAGYSRFSRWHNTDGTNGLDIYECSDPTEGAAVWTLIYETPAP